VGLVSTLLLQVIFFLWIRGGILRLNHKQLTVPIVLDKRINSLFTDQLSKIQCGREGHWYLQNAKKELYSRTLMADDDEEFLQR
jgi:hypothetical protein